jgi:hypothetical protein
MAIEEAVFDGERAAWMVRRWLSKAEVAVIALSGLLGGYAAAGSNALILFYVCRCRLVGSGVGDP